MTAETFRLGRLDHVHIRVAPSGDPLTAGHVVDLDLCGAFDPADPWGHVYELNCYDTVRAALIEADGIEPPRYWPAGLHCAYPAGHDGS